MTPTYEITLDSRQSGATEIAAQTGARRRRCGYSAAICGVRAPYDPARLSPRAARLVLLSDSTFSDGDDLSRTPVLLRRVGPIEEAVQSEAEASRAATWRYAYGRHVDGGVESCEYRGHAQAADAADCTEYLNRLAETPGLGVGRVLIADAPLEDGTRHAWAFMLGSR